VTDYLIPVTMRGSAVIGWHASGLSTRMERSWLRSVFRHLPPGMRRRLVSTMLVHREYAGRVKRL
jgi:hypothetical protein